MEKRLDIGHRYAENYMLRHTVILSLCSALFVIHLSSVLID